MAVSGLPAPPRRVLESFPEPPRAILERSETPPEHHKCVLEAINVSKRAPGRSKRHSGSSKDSLRRLPGREFAGFPALFFHLHSLAFVADSLRAAGLQVASAGVAKRKQFVIAFVMSL